MKVKNRLNGGTWYTHDLPMEPVLLYLPKVPWTMAELRGEQDLFLAMAISVHIPTSRSPESEIMRRRLFLDRHAGRSFASCRTRFPIRIFSFRWMFLAEDNRRQPVFLAYGTTALVCDRRGMFGIWKDAGGRTSDRTIILLYCLRCFGIASVVGKSLRDAYRAVKSMTPCAPLRISYSHTGVTWPIQPCKLPLVKI